jgi:hypothetical protein
LVIDPASACATVREGYDGYKVNGWWGQGRITGFQRRRIITASVPDGVAESGTGHFGNYPVLGTLLEMRDLVQMLAHAHDAGI